MLAKSRSIRHPRDRRGVSEIIGDILILAITVVLFTSVFFFVNAIPTPSSQTYANFQATLTPPVAGKSTLNITNTGGQTLNAYTTEIVIQENQTSSIYTMQLGNTYVDGAVKPWTANSWGVNEIWSLNLTGVSSTTVVSISIINKASNSLVWSIVLTGRTGTLEPLIEQAFADPNPAAPGGSIEIYAQVAGNPKTTSVNASLRYVNGGGTVNLTYNATSGLYSYGPFVISSGLQVGSTYPIIVNVSGPSRFTANYTISLLIERVGPSIITASINPNPATSGGNFTVTAYVTDTNSTEFNPNSVGEVTIKPYFGPEITNITHMAKMSPTSYSGIMVYKGHVNASATGFETFLINATDALGYYATYEVTLVVLSSYNTGNVNTSYPAPYLGPTSMSFSGFSWNIAGQNNYNRGYQIPVQDVQSQPGIYFNMILENHNTSHDLYLDGYSEIYFIFASLSPGGSNKLSSDMSFVVLNESIGATSWQVAPGSSHSDPSYVQSVYKGPANPYPALGPVPPQYQPNSYILLPAAVGGVALQANVSFGVSLSSLGTHSPIPPPQSDSGGFVTSVFSPNEVSPPAVSADFLMLFGYLIPAGSQVTGPHGVNPSSGVPYGQSLPFTAIYWY